MEIREAEVGNLEDSSQVRLDSIVTTKPEDILRLHVAMTPLFRLLCARARAASARRAAAARLVDQIQPLRDA